MSYYLGLDQGTSSTKAVLFKNNRLITKYSIGLSTKYTNQGWVEQDPIEIINNTISCIKKVLVKVKKKSNETIDLGVTNQTETFLIWDKKNGKPVIPAINWQCKRSSKLIKKFERKLNKKEILNKTGLNLDPTFTATKLLWIKNYKPKIFRKLEKNDYLFGTLDTWIIWCLTEKRTYATDVTNASRTLLFNIKKLNWDNSIIKQFGLQNISLPEIKKNNDNFGIINKKKFKLKIRITASIGDQQSSLYGHKCFKKGDIKITLGTGGFIWINSGNKFIKNSNSSCVQTLAWVKDKPVYAFEAFIVMVGSLIDYFIRNLKIAKNFNQLEKQALKVNKTDLLFFPSLNGLGTPWWYAKNLGVLFGLNSKTTDKEISLVVFETIGFLIRSALDSLKIDTKLNFNQISIDGKLSKSKLIQKILISLIDKDLKFSHETDLTSIGAVMLSSKNINLKNKMNKFKSLDVSNKNKYLNDKYLLWKKFIDNIIKRNLI